MVLREQKERDTPYEREILIKFRLPLLCRLSAHGATFPSLDVYSLCALNPRLEAKFQSRFKRAIIGIVFTGMGLRLPAFAYVPSTALRGHATVLTPWSVCHATASHAARCEPRLPKRTCVMIKTTQLLPGLLDLLPRLHPHVEDGAISRTAQNLRVHTALAPLTLCPEPSEAHL